jgi:type I restriction enzyme, S subunit
MSDLPPGWEWATLDELVCTDGCFTDGDWVESKDQDPNGDIRLIQLADVGEGQFRDRSNRYLTSDAAERLRCSFLRPGDVLIARMPEPLGRACLYPGGTKKTVTVVDVCIFRPGEQGVDPRWLMWWMNSPAMRQHILNLQTGTTRKRISRRNLSTIALSVPPLAEQRRIVAVLDDHLSRIDASESILRTATKKIAQMRDQYIATACTGGLASVAGISAPPPAYVGVQDGELPSLPDNWKWTRLAEIADVVGGVTKEAKRQADVELPEVPYLRVANVQRGRLNLDRVTLIRVPIDKVRQLRLKKGDVLLNEGGDRDKLGRGWIWEGQIPECIHQNHVFRARIHDNQLDPKLLAWHANTFGKGWCERNGKQSVNLASISLSKIRLLPVPVPPRNDQATLVVLIEEHLAELDQLAEALRRALRRSEHLRRSLLAEAFAGRLAQQDPNDEPAWVLLERIKTERTTQPKTRLARRTAKNVNPDQESML